jgi:RHS repeat-associated protein
VTDALGTATKYSYDKQGNKLTMTDGRGKLTRYAYTAFGNLKSVTNADNKAQTYKYDLEGNTACVTDKNGNNTIYTYGNRGLLIQRKVTETGDSAGYSYDEVGNRISMTDESGTSTYNYDENNRLTEIQKGGAAQISYAYDQLGNISKVTDLKGNTVEYTYDKSSRMETVNNGGKTTVYSYDDNGRRTSVTYEGGVSENYSYDRDNRLITLTNTRPNGGKISEYSYTYDLAGRQITKTDLYGTTDYEYDKAGRITKFATPGKTTIYAYDKAGNRVSQNETYISLQPSDYVDETTGKEIQYILKKSDYTYSNANQLLKLVEKMFDESNKEIARKTTKYTYDNNGNQLKQSISHTLPDNTGLRPKTTGTAYGDNVSNTIDKLVEKTSYTYDGFNRLKKTETVKAGIRTTVDFTYNGDDLRVSKTVKKSDKRYQAEVTNYLYDRQNVILETDASNNVKARYVKGINYISKADAAGKESYFLFNGHGDVVQTVDAAGTVQNQYDYDIWGNQTLTVETTSNAIRYTGEFYDEETGLYYLRARYYDPNLGRFTIEDSYWGEDNNPLSLNLYTYCENDPIQFTDPTGHSILGDIIKTIGSTIKDVIKTVTGGSKNSSGSSSGKSASGASKKPSGSSSSSGSSGKSSGSGSSSSSSGGNSSNSSSSGSSSAVGAAIAGFIGFIGFVGTGLPQAFIIGKTVDEMTAKFKEDISIKQSPKPKEMEEYNSHYVYSYYNELLGTVVYDDSSRVPLDAEAIYLSMQGKSVVLASANTDKAKGIDTKTIQATVQKVSKLIELNGKLPKDELKKTEDFLNEVKNKGTQEQLDSLLKGLKATGKLTITVNEKFDKYELKNNGTDKTEPNAEIRISNEKEFVEVSKSWREKHGGNYTTWDEAKAVYAVYDAGFRESDFASYSDYEKAVFEANAKIADEKFGMKPEEFLAVMMGIIIEKGISVKGSYSAFEEESVIYTKNRAAFVEAETIQVPGRVQSRINISNNGWAHVLKEHFSTKNKSQFTISQSELKTLLQNKDIIKTPVTRTLDSADGIRYVREIDVGKNIGNDKFNNFQPTTKMTILTDKYGNLITATPGVIK